MYPGYSVLKSSNRHIIKIDNQSEKCIYNLTINAANLSQQMNIQTFH